MEQDPNQIREWEKEQALRNIEAENIRATREPNRFQGMTAPDWRENNY